MVSERGNRVDKRLARRTKTLCHQLVRDARNPAADKAESTDESSLKRTAQIGNAKKNYPELVLTVSTRPRNLIRKPGRTRRVREYKRQALLAEHRRAKGWAGAIAQTSARSGRLRVLGHLKGAAREKFECAQGTLSRYEAALQHGAPRSEASLVSTSFTLGREITYPALIFFVLFTITGEN